MAPPGGIAGIAPIDGEGAGMVTMQANGQLVLAICDAVDTCEPPPALESPRLHNGEKQ